MSLYTFDDVTTRDIVSMLKWWRVNRGESSTLRQSFVSENYEKFGQWKNNSGETCPAYGVFAVTSFSSGIAQGTKPNTTFRRQYLVNGPTSLANGGTGYYQKLSEVIALYDSGTPALGESYGPKSGEWKLFANYPSTADVLTIEDSTNKYLRCNWHPINFLIGKLNASLSQGGTAAMSVYAGYDYSTDTGWDVTGRDALKKSGAAVNASGKKAFMSFKNGIWIYDNMECA